MAGESAVRSTVGTVGPVHWDRLGAPEWLIPGARADPKVECILDIEKESLGYGYWGGGRYRCRRQWILGRRLSNVYANSI